MILIKTDRDYFKVSADGVEIHSGKLMEPYDWQMLKDGKYLPMGLASQYEIVCNGWDLEETYCEWELIEI